jgi:PAS domain S-box-containing protein
LRIQFVATTIAMAVLPMLSVALLLGLVVVSQVTSTMRDEAFDRLDSVRASRVHEIDAYFDERKSDMAALVETARALRMDALDQLTSVRNNRARVVKDWFEDRMNDALFVSNLRAVRGSSGVDEGLAVLAQYKDNRSNLAYAQAFAQAESVLSAFAEARDYADIMLVDLTGEVVFALDVQSLWTNEADSVEFQRGLEGLYVGDMVPAHDELNLRITTPVKDYREQTVGVLFLELRTNGLDAIMTKRPILGQTFDIYLVGPDRLFRSNSRFVDESVIFNPAYVVNTTALTETLVYGRSGVQSILDYRGQHVLSAFAPLEIADLEWAIVAEIDLVEALSPRRAETEQDFYAQYKENYDYADLFLIDPDGYIFYSVRRELDYQTNILNGPYQDSNLADLVRAVLYKTQAIEVSDFESYAPSGGEPAAFFAAPLLGPDGVEMVVATQVSLEQINAIMQERAGLGETGEAYLVGPDKLFRSDSRLLMEQQGLPGTVLNQEWPVDTQASRSALDDVSDVQIINDYRGKRVLSSWSPVVLEPPDAAHQEGLKWALIAEMDESEALEPVQELRDFITSLTLGLVVIVALLAIGLSAWFSGNLVRPILGLTRSATAIAGGDLDAELEAAARADEVGVLTNAFGAMVGRLRETIHVVQERSAELDERGRELEASQRVTFAASELTSPDELLGLVVDLVRDQFGLYHAQVYIVDEDEGAAVLRQSTGYAGSQLLQRKHRIPLERASLVTRAIHSGEHVLVQDVSQDTGFMSNPLLPHTRSELVVPLKLRQRVIGVLDVQDRAVGRFMPSTVELFRTMAEQVASLFESSELMERVNEQREAMTLLTTQLRTAAEIASYLGTILDPGLLLQEVVSLLQSRFGLYHAHIYTLTAASQGESSDGELVVSVGSGEVGRVLRESGHSVPLDAAKSLVARAAREQRVIFVSDATLDSDFTPNPLLPNTRSEMAVPLVAGDRVLGVLDLQDDRPGRFSQVDADTFSTLAGQIAVSLQNASLFEQTQARLKVSQALAGLQSEDDVLDAMMRVSGFDRRVRVSLFTRDHEAEELAFVARREESFESGIVSAIPPGMRLALSEFPLGHHLSPHEPLVSSNLPLDERSGPGTRDLVRKMECTSVAMLPIAAGDEWLGLMIVSAKPEGYFDERKLHLYTALAEQGAVALQAAHLRAEVQKSEREYRELNAGLRDGVGSIDMQGKFQSCNPAFEEMVGYSIKELRQMDIRDLTPAKWHAMEASILEDQVLSRGYSDTYEKEFIRSDGTIFPAELTAYLTRDEGGNPSGFWAYVRDITARVQAEQALRQSEERFRDIALSTSDWVWEVDALGRYIYVSDKVVDVMGYTAEEMLDKTPFDLMSPEEAARVGEIFGEIMANAQPIVDMESWCITKDGREVCMLTDGVPLFDAQGNLIGYRGVDKDITERKRAEQTLRERMSIIENSLDFMGIATLDGQGVYVNPAGLAMTGYTAEEFYDSMGIASFQPDLPREALETAMREGVWTGESTLVHKDGRVIPLSQIITVIEDEQGNPQLFATVGRDITERKQADQAMRESEKRFRTLFESMVEGVALHEMVYDQDGEPIDYRITDINPAYTSHTGLTRQAAVGALATELYGAQDPPYMDVYTRVAEMGESAFFDVYFPSLERHFHVSVFSPGQGQFATVFEDVTEARQTEERLRQANLVVENSPVVLFRWRADGHWSVEFVSENVEQIFGYTPQELLSGATPYAELVYPQDLERVAREVQEFSESGVDSFRQEYRIVTKDGQVRWTDDRTVIERDAGGQITHYQGIVIDVTAAKQAELERARFTAQLRTAASLAEQINAILEPERLLQEVVDQLHDRFDLYHAHVYLLEEVDKVERPLTGPGQALVLRAGYGKAGRAMLEQGHSIPLERQQSLVARAARGREVVLENDVQAVPDFMPNPLLPNTRSEAAVPLLVGERVLGVFDVQDDQPGRFTPSELDVFSTLAGQIAIALQNAAFVEEIQKTTQELRALDRLKSEFMASMSHELRTPLNSIIGFAEVMLMGISGDLSTEVREDVQAIYDNGQNLLNIINDILDLAKIEAGALVLDPKSVDVAALLRDVQVDNTALLANRDLEMLLQIEDDLPTLQVDARRIRQIMDNLVSNAIKFTERGVITLRAFSERREARGEVGATWLCLEVQDTGIGISAGDMGKIFERFQQVDGSHARRAGGAGLGLHITRLLVELHGGVIKVTSQPGEGSTFSVCLPANPQVDVI